jgi:hypothetical protein
VAALSSLPRLTLAATAAEELTRWRGKVTAYFPYLPDAIITLPDAPPGSNFNVRFVDLDQNGIPRFERRSDFSIDELTAYHEMGHENEAQLIRAGMTKDDLRNQWWSFRQFPGTWQQQQADVDSGFYGPPGSLGYWDNSPVEMVAEALKCAVYGYAATERTQNFGNPVRHDDELRFWQDLWRKRNVEVPMRTYQFSMSLSGGNADRNDSVPPGPILLTEASRLALRLVSGQGRVYQVDLRRIGLAGSESSLPDTRAWLTENTGVPIGQDGRWKLYAMVRRDFGALGYYLACIDDVTGTVVTP